VSSPPKVTLSHISRLDEAVAHRQSVVVILYPNRGPETSLGVTQSQHFTGALNVSFFGKSLARKEVESSAPSTSFRAKDGNDIGGRYSL